jgi:hypothetical protein
LEFLVTFANENIAQTSPQMVPVDIS